MWIWMSPVFRLPLESPPAPSLFILKTAEPLYTRGFYSWLTWLIALASDWRRMRQRQPLRESMWEMVLNPVICYQGDRWKHMHCCVSLWTKIVLVQGPSMPQTKKMMNTNSFFPKNPLLRIDFTIKPAVPPAVILFIWKNKVNLITLNTKLPCLFDKWQMLWY